jgi:segregation and condensation protein B
VSDDSDNMDDEQEQQFLGGDLEEAYLGALEANDAAEWEIGPSVPEQADEEALAPPVVAEPATDDAPESTPNDEIPEEDQSTTFGTRDAAIRPEQVIEAALFVGGTALTTKKLRSLLQGNCDADLIEQAIDTLNVRYEREERPYEIRLAEGGYRLLLRSEYRKIQNRVFGLGPKEVRLSQDSLEVLALVAYKQPVTKQAIEAEGKDNAASVLRQLLRRELIQIERNGGSRKDVKYRTSPRFLSLFGLGSLDELPQAGDFEMK